MRSVIVVEVGNAAVSRDLGVNVATLALVEVDLRLQDVDLLRLHLQLLLKVLLHVSALLLLLGVVILEDRVRRARQLVVQLLLLLALVADHVQQVRVLLDAVGQLALDLLQLSILLLLVADALLLSALVFLKLVEDGLTLAGNLERVKVDQVTETEHLSFLVLTFLLIAQFLLFVDLALHLDLVLFALSLLGLQVLNLDVELALTLDKLQELRAGDEHR